jgi:hypothetical protein
LALVPRWSTTSLARSWEWGDVGETMSTPRQVPGLTVALDTPSARVLADQASVVQDLQFVMDCCKRLLAELARPETDRDGVVPQALWSSAVVAYARCFGQSGQAGGGEGSGLVAEDVRSLPLQGAVMNFHEWIIEQRDKIIAHPADPFEAAKVGVALSPAGQKAEKDRRVEGIAIFSNSHVLIDGTGVQQLGGLASELAKQTAGKAQAQQDSVLTGAQLLDLGSLYASPPLPTY